LSGKCADNRPGLQAALRDACTHKAVLVAYDLTRLARSTSDAIDIAQRLRKCGAQLGLITLDIDTSTPMGEYIFTMFAALGQLERQITAEKTRVSLAHKRESGLKYSGVTPYGYRCEGDALVADDDEQRVLCDVRTMRAGGRSYESIADDLNTRHVPTRSGKRWRWATVRNMLENRMRQTEQEKNTNTRMIVLALVP
jgi:DNA invertase Pin-like site-specific DNA recombinase